MKIYSRISRSISNEFHCLKNLILKLFLVKKKRFLKKKPRNCNSSWFLQLFHLRFLIWNIFYLYMSLPSWRRYSWCHLGRWHGLGDRRLQGGRGRERQRLGRPFGIHLSRSWWSENRWIFFSQQVFKGWIDSQPSLVESWKFFGEKSHDQNWVYFCWSCWWKEKGK